MYNISERLVNITENIYVLEDDDNIRKLVCYALSREGYCVKGFPAPSEFYTEYENQKPDLILLDIMLPEEDGISILKKICLSGEDIHVIMMTAKDSEIDTVTGLDSGADDYISKPFGITELVSRVRAVMRRGSKKHSAEEITYRIGELFVSPAEHIVKVSEQEVYLSYKEYRLLIALIEAGGKVITREELFSIVWGEYYGESRTLDVHIRNLRMKLGTAGKYIQTVKNIGYKTGGEIHG